MAVAKGKDRILLVRNLKDETTDNATFILYQTELNKTISKAIEEEVTKTGTVKTSGSSTTEITTTALAQEDDTVLDKLEDGMHTDERYGFWEINQAVKGSEPENADKYKSLYYEGEISNFDQSAGSEGSVEVSLELSIDGAGQRGFATLTAEQEEFVQYVFKDTTPIEG